MTGTARCLSFFVERVLYPKGVLALRMILPFQSELLFSYNECMNRAKQLAAQEERLICHQINSIIIKVKRYTFK